METGIHSSAIVDDGAVLGEGTRVWHFSHICGGARIGKGCSLGQNVFVGNDVVIGNNVKIQNNVSVYDAVTIEDDVFCGPSMVFTNVYNPRSAVPRKNEYRKTLIRRGATLGANTTIVCGVTVGEHAFIAAGAVVHRDVPAFALMAGVPAARIGWMSRHGERLDLPVDGDGEAVCPHTGERYLLRDGVCTLSYGTGGTEKPSGTVRQKMEFIDLKTQYRLLQPAIRNRIDAVLDHGQYIMGPEVEELERRLADYAGARHCITVASGTEALLISLMALGIKPGDEVVTTAFSFVATAEVIALLGARPVFVDIERDTCNIDAALIEACITPKTRAIMPVSLYGQPADMDEINTIAVRHGIAVIEDGAQSFGATYRGRRSCNLSAIGCTSFFPSKPLGCYGDGGAILTSDATLAQAMREIRVHGQSQRYVHTRLGVGGRMDTLQCAIVLAKLDRFDEELELRRAIAARYDALLDGRVEVMRPRADRSSAFGQYTVGVEQRDEVQAWLREFGIPTAVHYPLPITRQTAYAQFAKHARCPVAEEMAGKVLSLPMGPYMRHEQVERVAEALLTADGRLGAAGTRLERER
jgi:dTDP-4-amino-4,6-dideoxygalactose transaminase/acetyltransferase-like isoleucine patch superfamily enzyme